MRCIDYQDRSPLEVVFGPASVPQECVSEDLRINVYRGGSDVDDQLGRAGLEPGEQRYVVDGEGGAVILRVHHNVLVAVVATSKCFSEPRVAKALDDVG